MICNINGLLDIYIFYFISLIYWHGEYVTRYESQVSYYVLQHANNSKHIVHQLTVNNELDGDRGHSNGVSGITGICTTVPQA